jgi:hypothetical protein
MQHTLVKLNYNQDLLNNQDAVTAFHNFLWHNAMQYVSQHFQWIKYVYNWASHKRSFYSTLKNQTKNTQLLMAASRILKPWLILFAWDNKYNHQYNARRIWFDLTHFSFKQRQIVVGVQFCYTIKYQDIWGVIFQQFAYNLK